MASDRSSRGVEQKALLGAMRPGVVFSTFQNNVVSEVGRHRADIGGYEVRAVPVNNICIIETGEGNPLGMLVE